MTEAVTASSVKPDLLSMISLNVPRSSLPTFQRVSGVLSRLGDPRMQHNPQGHQVYSQNRRRLRFLPCLQAFQPHCCGHGELRTANVPGRLHRVLSQARASALNETY